MPWFPDFVSAVELARKQTRAAGLADPVGQYFTALNKGDAHVLETAWPGEVVVYDPRAGEVRGHRHTTSSAGAATTSRPRRDSASTNAAQTGCWRQSASTTTSRHPPPGGAS